MWEYLVIKTIRGLEQMSKNVEIKWVKTKGNENMTIKPLSFLGNIWYPILVTDRGFCKI